MAYKVQLTEDAEQDLDRYVRYFMLYRIVEKCVIVDNIFHELQDFEKKMS